MANKPSKVFIDTSGWYAVSSRKDVNHNAADAYYRRLLRRKTLLLTSDYVLDETITRLRYDLGHAQALTFWRRIESAASSGRIRILRVDERTWAKSIEIFAGYSDQLFSLTDCTSFVLAQESGVDEVFAFDEDFRLFGLIVNPVT